MIGCHVDASSTPPHGKSIYPWKTWTDGRGHWVRRGMHFLKEAKAFRNMLLSAAKRRGLKVVTRVRGDAVWFQFSPKEST
jgi:hypothetical protein